jgi:hypothetical protein
LENQPSLGDKNGKRGKIANERELNNMILKERSMCCRLITDKKMGYSIHIQIVKKHAFGNMCVQNITDKTHIKNMDMMQNSTPGKANDSDSQVTHQHTKYLPTEMPLAIALKKQGHPVSV